MGLYQDLLMNHLREHRPKEYAGLQAAGDLESHVQEVGEEISEAVETYRQQLLQAKPPPKEDVAKMQHLQWAQRTAKEVILAEYLTMDEVTESLIGPSGGYED